jgi:hypothetical protein
MGILESYLQEVLDGVERYRDKTAGEIIPNNSAPLLPLPDGKELQQIFTALLSHIEANTPKAERYLMDLPHYASSTFEEGRHEIMASLEQFDFESARNFLLRLASQVGVILDGP